jgi:SAM-dependent methyltransferase
MDAAEYAVMFEVEDRLWWYAGMRRITQTLLDAHCTARPLRVLDAGCGTGANLALLARYGQVTGIDIEPLALDYCRRRGLSRLVRASVAELPFASGGFDLVTSFEVIYHAAVSDDVAALREFARVLRPGGWLLLRLPAYDWLRGRHDLAVHTQRRYTTGELGRKARAAGLTVVRLSYANTLLFPIALAKRLAERCSPTGAGSDVGPPPSGNGLLTGILSLEAVWLRRWSLPFGLSVICLARKM